MAITQLEFAPFITPKTLEELARILREGKEEKSAQGVADLKPFLLGVINNCFEPITRTSKPNFWRTYDKYSREYEPYRLYINLKLFELIGNENFLSIYKLAFAQITQSLLQSASDKGVEPERLNNVLQVYFDSFKDLANLLTDLTKLSEPSRLEDINLAHWLRTATRLDYSLTAIFLFIEDAVPSPPKTVRELLLVASEKSVQQFLDDCKNFISVVSATEPIEKRKHTGIGKYVRTLYIEPLELPVPIAKEADIGSQAGEEKRAEELTWLSKNRELLHDLAEKWIVIEGNDLVAAHAQYEKARALAQEKGVTRPFIIYVPKPTEEIFMGI